MLSNTLMQPRPRSTSPTLSTVTGIGLILIGAFASMCNHTWGKSEKETATLEGTISSVERKGKVTKVTLKTEEGEHTFELTANVELKITYEGDREFLIPGMFLKADCTSSNGQGGTQMYYNCDQIEVYPQYTAKAKIPRASVVETSPKIGNVSVYRCVVSGPIVKKYMPPERVEDSGQVELIQGLDYHFFVKFGSVMVVLSDSSRLEIGQQATVTGRWTGKKPVKKFVPQSVTVTTGQELWAADSLDELTEKKSEK